MTIDATQLPEYQTNTTVRAAKILSTQGPRSVADAYEIQLDGVGPVLVSFREFIERHSAEAGGYLVVYADGHEGYLPADTFEDLYGAVPAPKATKGKPKSLPPVPSALVDNPSLPTVAAPDAEVSK